MIIIIIFEITITNWILSSFSEQVRLSGNINGKQTIIDSKASITVINKKEKNKTKPHSDLTTKTNKQTQVRNKRNVVI